MNPSLSRACWAMLFVAVLTPIACDNRDPGGLFLDPELVLPQYTVVSTGYAYSLDAQFDEGTLISVHHDAPRNDQLQLNGPGSPLGFIWVAASARGTIVKIDTKTGQILGEYRSAPQGMNLNPSRTTVDANGGVWAGNRSETAWIAGKRHGSVVKIGLEENNQCVDRNGNGSIDTSSGLGDIFDWPDVTDGVGSTDGAGHIAQVQDAADECILIYQRTPDADGVRHLSVDMNNDVWVGGFPYALRMFHKLAGTTGAILQSFSAIDLGCGGYGGLIDGNNVLWSASFTLNNLLRYDLNTLTGTCIPVALSYGLGIDSNGFIWNAMYGNPSYIVKISPTGVIEPGFPKLTGGGNARGVAIAGADNHVWVANSGSASVTRLDNAGNQLANIQVGFFPTGVAVDAAGKIWVTNMASDDAMRIDPATNLVDLTVDLGPGAGPYNYSDMTGAFVHSAPTSGVWTVIQDGGEADTPWGRVTWNTEPEGSEPAGTSITVSVRVANLEAGLLSKPWLPVSNGANFNLPGRFIEARAQLQRGDPNGESPVLSDLAIDIDVVEVGVAIKPGSRRAPINPKSGGLVPVAILGSAEFDVMDLDVSTLVFGPNAATPVHDLSNPTTHADHLGDVNGDGFTDLMSHYAQKETGLRSTDTEGCIAGSTLGGRPIHGCDAIRIVGKTRKSNKN